MITRKLTRKDKYIIRKIVLLFLLAVLLAIPVIILNERYFIHHLGWNATAFPLLLSVCLWFVIELFVNKVEKS